MAQKDYEDMILQKGENSEEKKNNYMFKTDNSMEDLENPISAMMANKHPEIQDEIKNASLYDMMKSGTDQ